MSDSTKPSEAGERALRLLLTLEPSGAQPHINGSAAKVLVRDGWLSGVKGSYSLTVKARNFLAGVVDLVTTETRGVPAPDGYGYVPEYQGTCQHGNVSAWFRSGGEAMDAARDHGDIDDQPYREPSDGYAADRDTRMLLASRAVAIGYTDGDAFDLAERAYYIDNGAPCGDECDTHPGIRRYSNGECEACETERQFFAAARETDPVAIDVTGTVLEPLAGFAVVDVASVPEERSCALLCGTGGAHTALCIKSQGLICQADFGTGYCVLPIHDGDKHRDMWGNWVKVATTGRLGDPEPSDPVTHGMAGALNLWRRSASATDIYTLMTLIRVMDGVKEQSAPYAGKAEQVKIFDAGTAYGMLLMCRTIVASVIGSDCGMKAEVYVIDYVRRSAAEAVGR